MTQCDYQSQSITLKKSKLFFWQLHKQEIRMLSKKSNKLNHFLIA